MFERQKLTASIADLDTSLTDVHRDDFTHFQRELKLRVQRQKISIVDDEWRVESNLQKQNGEKGYLDDRTGQNKEDVRRTLYSSRFPTIRPCHLVCAFHDSEHHQSTGIHNPRLRKWFLGYIWAYS